MSELEDWLAAMPPEAQIDARISWLENELELLHTVKRVRAAFDRSTARASMSFRGSEAEVPDSPIIGSDPAIDPTRLSVERRRIIRVMRESAQDTASPAEVTAGLRERGFDADEQNVATNMQRMKAAGLLKREARGRYSVVPAAAALAREMDDRDAREQELDMPT